MAAAAEQPPPPEDVIPTAPPISEGLRQRAEGLRLRAEQREAAEPEPPVDIPHTIEEHAAGREAIQATRKLHVAHANAELAEWSGLRPFVHVTEEAGLLLPMDCPCCGKVSCVRWEK